MNTIGLRYRIAHLMDKRPGQCWADLVMYAQYEDGPLFKPSRPVTPACFQGPGDTCYCGKFQRPDGA